VEEYTAPEALLASFFGFGIVPSRKWLGVWLKEKTSGRYTRKSNRIGGGARTGGSKQSERDRYEEGKIKRGGVRSG